MYDYMIVGAGFAGATMARLIAEELGKKVLIVDRRPHIGGNAYDYYNDAGILVHKYGPHIFHTNSEKVYQFLSRFTEWRPYQHRVLASVEGQLVPLPINLDTVNQLYGMQLDQQGVIKYLDSVRQPDLAVRNSRDIIIKQVGEDLYNKFFKQYTKKQWGVFPDELDASVCARIPVRTNRDNRYFTDTYQAMPKHGYTRLFENMLNHPLIHTLLNADFREVSSVIHCTKLVYTGPIDDYFNQIYGKLPYRSLEFRQETLPVGNDGFDNFLFPVATINHPNDYEYTRVTEMKHLTGQTHRLSTIVYEYPISSGDPYYPIPNAKNQAHFKMYEDLSKTEKNVIFIGRLGTYKYYNMDQIVAQSMTSFKQLEQQ